MKLKVNKFCDKDIESRVKWINNASVYNQMYFDIPASIDNTSEWYKGLSGRKNRIDFSVFDEEGICVGMSGITDIDFSNQNAEFYVFINPELQGKGYGHRITTWTINFYFVKYSLNKLYLYTDASNKIAIKIYDRLGFVKEGVQRAHKFKNGAFKDRIMYSLLRSEWEQALWMNNCLDFMIDDSNP